MRDQDTGAADIHNEDPDAARPDRRELIKKLGKAATLPMVVGTFLASDVTVEAGN